MGDCTGSICLAYGLESCQCIAGPSDPDTKACELCCKEPGEDTACKSSFLWNDVPFDVPDMFAKPGTPCNDYNGYEFNLLFAVKFKQFLLIISTTQLL